MAKSNIITLEDFISKATQKYQDRKISMNINIDGMGLVTFSRPTENELLVYLNKSGNSIVTDKKGNVISQDMVTMLAASKDLVFSTCSYLQNIDLQKQVEAVDPIDAVTKVFGITKTMEIATDIAQEFMDKDMQNKVEKKVKN